MMYLSIKKVPHILLDCKVILTLRARFGEPFWNDDNCIPESFIPFHVLCCLGQNELNEKVVNDFFRSFRTWRSYLNSCTEPEEKYPRSVSFNPLLERSFFLLYSS